MIQFYKPNAKNTGTACSFWLNRDGSVMSSMIKQASWDSKKRIGSFAKNKDNPKGRVITKLSRTEVGGVLDSLESNREFSAYHQSQNQVLQIKFCPYLRDGNQVGFSFSINKQEKEDSTAKTGFIIPEARLLRHDLENFLDKTAPSSQNNQEEKPIEIEESDLSDENDGDDDGGEMPW